MSNKDIDKANEEELNRIYSTLTIIQPLYKKAEDYLLACLFLINKCKDVLRQKIIEKKNNMRVISNEDEKK